MATTSAAQPLGAVPVDDFAQVLLEVSLTGLILFRPLCATPGGPVQDLAYEHLNPAAQRMLRLPERPTDTFLTLYPSAQETGIFAFYAAAFASSQTERYQVNYQHDGLDGYFYLVARRHGELLVVSFTDTNDQPRSAVEEALRQSQARERAARAEAEAQRQRLLNLFEQAPAMVATYRGPDHVLEFVNGRSLAALGKQQVAGRPFREVAPELASQGIFDLLDHVYRTGETYFANEAPVYLEQGGQLTLGYYSFIYQATYDAAGQRDGILNFAYEVTDQVLARQRVQDLNEKLAATNEELAATNEELIASNEEYLLANTALSEAQQQLQQLNAELEERVQQRTQQLAAASQQLALEREGFFQILEQTPAAICILRGPEHRIAYHNPAHQQLYGGRKLVGHTVVEGIPQVEAQGYTALLDGVYRTGQPQYGYEVPNEVQDAADEPLRLAYFNFTFSAYREGGAIVGVSIFAYEVTEQVHLRQQREAQQAEVQRLFAQAPMAIVVLRGPTFIIEQANENAEAIWGRTAAQVLGRPHFEALPDSAGQGFEEMLTGVLESGEPVVLHEVPIQLERAHTGLPATGYYTIIFKPLRDEYQRVTRIAVMWTEATDQVLARQQVQALNKELAAINEELHESNMRLTRANTDLGTFVYTASHDLKAPITNIEGLVLALRDALPALVQQDELVAYLLGLLDTTAHRFVNTISQLTDLSRLQIAYEEPAESLALAPVVEGVLADLAPVIAEAQATIQVQVPEELCVSLAPASLRSIVYNLLSNAVKYRDPQRPAQVWLQAEQQPESIVFTVRDNGLGLTDSQQQRLFHVFQRLHTHVEGSGVGLYMIKRLIENAGASIAVTSIVDVGTTFTVTFPA